MLAQKRSFRIYGEVSLAVYFDEIATRSEDKNEKLTIVFRGVMASRKCIPRIEIARFIRQ